MRFGAKGLMSTLMRVRISSDAPRCTVQFGALDPRCTMVQVHGDPNEPSLGAGAAVAPCVTLDGARAGAHGVGGVSGEGRAPARADACIQAPSPPSPRLCRELTFQIRRTLMTKTRAALATRTAIARAPEPMG